MGHTHNKSQRLDLIFCAESLKENLVRGLEVSPVVSSEFFLHKTPVIVALVLRRREGVVKLVYSQGLMDPTGF